MDDQLDNDLRYQILDVFENYDDGHADEGWLLLREKYPEKEKRKPVAWLWWSSAVAALLLLLLGILWFSYSPLKKQTLTSVKKQPLNKPTQKAFESGKDSSLANNNVRGSSAINTAEAQNPADREIKPAAILKHKSLIESGQPLAFGAPIIDHNDKRAGQGNIIQANISQKNVTPGETGTGSPDATQPIALTAAIAAAKTDSGTRSGIHSTEKAENAASAGVNMLDEVKKINKVLFADNEPSKPKSISKSDKAVRFEVYAATYLNYAKGSSSQFNLGAGLSSDIKLSRTLGLVTGVSVGQNTLSYSSQLPVNSPAAATADIAYNPLGIRNLNGYSVDAPTLKNYNASLVGLEIPLNLKYQFNPEKSTTYISVGVSSGTFINETYTSTYNYSAPFLSSLSQNSDQTVHQSFNSFYFAKTLNLSFGTGYGIGRNKLIVEPFLKYPLDGLGSQQIKFGAGGLNLKFKFH